MKNHPIISLMQLEWLHERKNKSATASVLLYVVSVVFICYQSFRLKGGSLSPSTWSALFWMIILFSTVNASVRTFDLFRDGRYLYYYQLASARTLLISKLVFNSLYFCVVSIVAFLVYATVMGFEGINLEVFVPTLLLGSLGLGGTLTSVSGIASKAGNTSSLLAILAFPLLLPQLLLLIKLTKQALDHLPLSSSIDEMLTLSGINMISISLGYLLFPYLWRA